MRRTQQALLTSLLSFSPCCTAVEQRALTPECPYQNPFHRAIFTDNIDLATMMAQETTRYSVDINAQDTVATHHCMLPSNTLLIQMACSACYAGEARWKANN